MKDTTDKNDAPHTELELGYRFHLNERVDAIGYPSLGIVLHEAPTRHYFDPVAVHLPVAAKSQRGNVLEHLIVHHNWSGQERYRVCAGRVRMFDRQKNSVQAFTYGGSLSIYRADDYTTLTIASPAPILELIYPETPESLSMLLASETEHLLAERRAYWSQRKPGAFEDRLTQAGPRTLYRACIAELRRRFASYAKSGDALMRQLAHLLQREEEEFSQEPEQPQPLAEII
jgi:hypothetical protein